MISIKDYMKDGVRNIFSYPVLGYADERSAVEKAEAKFVELAMAKGIPEAQAIEAVEDGYVFVDDYGINLTWSNI